MKGKGEGGGGEAQSVPSRLMSLRRSPTRTVPLEMRPVAMRPTKGSSSIMVTSMAGGASRAPPGAGTACTIRSSSGARLASSGGAPPSGSSGDAHPCAQQSPSRSP